MKEIWKDVKGYKGYYKVSNTGKIMSLGRWKQLRKGVWQKTNNRLLKTNRPHINNVVCLWRPSRKWMTKVSIVVGRHFIPNPKNYPCIRYKTHNYSAGVENLEWVPWSIHRKTPVNQISMNSGKIVKTFDSQIEASTKTGISYPGICNVLRGYRHASSAGGFKWAYA